MLNKLINTDIPAPWNPIDAQRTLFYCFILKDEDLKMLTYYYIYCNLSSNFTLFIHIGFLKYYIREKYIGKPYPKRLWLCFVLTKDRRANILSLFPWDRTQDHTVPIVEKFVERAKADCEPTQGNTPYCTVKTAVLDKILCAGEQGQREQGWRKGDSIC